MRAFDGWAAVTTSKLCEDVPRGIFDEKGTIGEAAVATMLCTCVNLPYRCGLGGGFFAVYYSRRDKAAKAIIARVVAPQKARFDMFDQDVNGSLLGESQRGAGPGLVFPPAFSASGTGPWCF
ncbi:glutathione hydrolase 1 proenzyme-like [Haemaphysalis longicornis]